MNFSVNEDCRAQILAELPRLFKKALEDYDTFAAQPVPTDPAGFKKHQEACKSFAGNVAAIYKLWLLVTGKKEEDAQPEDLQFLFERAEEELKRHPLPEEDDA